ncbi:hypothetical protein niasHT_003631 [Heterodera trifolii]|uniref:Uncharacterized protein n=1 Tax=Heterodera trifolii TaxID=157864 RepID=A0ABD2MES0_9BILA
MKAYFLFFILIVYLTSIEEGLAKDYKPLITDRKNGLHLFNILREFCRATNASFDDHLGHQFHFKIDEGFCEEDGLLICYPSQWSATNDGKIPRRFNPNFGIKYDKIQERCEKIKKECKEFGGKENCGNSAYMKWHGILLKTHGTTVMGTNLTLRSSFLGKQYWGKVSDQHKAFVVELDHRRANILYGNEFNAHISYGAFLHDYKSLALLGLDIMPHKRGQNLLELFVNRTCGCSLKAWFTNPNNDLRGIEWNKLDHGNEKCDEKSEKMSLKYHLNALKPFNESCEIVLEGRMGKSPEQISVAIAKDWGELSWTKYIGMIADSIISKGQHAQEQKEEWQRYRNNSKLFEIVLTKNGTTLWAQGNRSMHFQNFMFLKEGGKIKISIYLKRFSYTCKINDKKIDFEMRPVYWFERLPYAHMDHIRIKGDFIPVKQIELLIHNENEKTPKKETPYYEKLDKESVQQNTVFNIKGELHPYAQYLRVSFLYNAYDRNVIVGETVFEICANLSRRLVNFRSYPYDFNETRNSQRHIFMNPSGKYDDTNWRLPMVERTSYLSLTEGGGFEISVKFTDDVLDTLVNLKQIRYVRNNLTTLWPLWKITNVGVSGDANLFIGRTDRLFSNTRPIYFETSSNIMGNTKSATKSATKSFVKRLDSKLLPGDIIRIKGKLTQSLIDGMPITISFLSRTNDPYSAEIETIAKCKSKTGVNCQAFCPLRLQFVWNGRLQMVQLHVTALNGYEKINVSMNENLPSFKKNAGEEIDLWIRITYNAYILNGHGNAPTNIFIGDGEKKALPAWLVEFIHIFAPLDMTSDYPSKETDERYDFSNHLPKIMELKKRLQVGDKVIINATMRKVEQIEMFELGFYTPGWSYIRPFSRIQFNIRFAYEPDKIEMYSDFWNWKTMLYKQWLVSYDYVVMPELPFYMALTIVNETNYDIHLNPFNINDHFSFKFGDVKGFCERCMDTGNLDSEQKSWAMPIWTADFVVVKNYLTSISITIKNKNGQIIQ